MVLVLKKGRYKVYVYAEYGTPHHLPHCNVRWSDGDSQVALPSGEVLAGSGLPRDARALIEEGLDDVIAAWNQLNPERRVDDE